MSRRVLRLLVATTATLFLGTAAMAASTEEDLTLRWLDGIAGPYGLSVGTSSYDVATDTVDIDQVKIGSLARDFFEITFDRLSIEDPHEVAGGLFAAHAVRGSGYHIAVHFDFARIFPGLAGNGEAATGTPAAGSGKAPVGSGTGGSASEAAPPPAADAAPAAVADYDTSADTVLAERLVMPMTGPDVGEGASAIDKWLKVGHWATAIRADWIEADNISTKMSDGGRSDMMITYRVAFASGVKEGRIERAGASDIHQTPTFESAPFRSIDIGEAYVIGIDVAAGLDAIDPAAYDNQPGDGQRRTIYSQYGASNISLAGADGLTAKLAGFEADGVYLRQTEKPLVALLDQLMTHPEHVEKDPLPFVADVMPAATGLMGIDLVQATDLKVSDGKIFDLSLGSFDINAVSSDGIGAVTFRDIAGSANDGTVKGSLDLFTVQNVHFGSLKSLLAIGAAGKTGASLSPETMRDAILNGGTAIGFVEAIALSLETPEGSGGFDSVAVTSSDLIGTLPRRLDITATGINFPVTLIKEPKVRDQMAEMGYDAISLSAGATVSWNTDRGTLDVDDIRVKALDMGSASLDLNLGNLPLSILDDPAKLKERMMEGTLDGASIRYGNEGIVEKAFDLQARKAKQDGTVFRRNVANAVPLMLTFLNNRDIQQRFSGPIREFLNNPKSIELTIRPRAPVPFSAFEAIDRNNPEELLKLLNVDVLANR